MRPRAAGADCQSGVNSLFGGAFGNGGNDTGFAEAYGFPAASSDARPAVGVHAAGSTPGRRTSMLLVVTKRRAWPVAKLCGHSMNRGVLIAGEPVSPYRSSGSMVQALNRRSCCAGPA